MFIHDMLMEPRYENKFRDLFSKYGISCHLNYILFMTCSPRFYELQLEFTNLVQEAIHIETSEIISYYAVNDCNMKDDPEIIKQNLAVLRQHYITTQKEFRNWLLKNHPDKGGDPELAKKIVSLSKSLDKKQL